MGSACTKSEAQASTIFPRFVVGHDYQELEGQYTGEGVKKTIAWKATITEDELKARREEFWRSRTSGRRQVWLALREAAETDAETARLLLQIAEIFTEKETMTVCFDTNGLRYELPVFVLNDPVTYFNGPAPKKKKPKLREEEVEVSTNQVKLRLMPQQQDISIRVMNTSTVAELKVAYTEARKGEGGQARLFFGGRELKDEATLQEYAIQSGFVVQVFQRK